MDFLRLLEGIRTPFLDSLFSLITHGGEEVIFMAVGMLLYWCINKNSGLYILTSGLAGTVSAQWLKIVCRVPRPWALDENFTIVESARAGANDYSFPSGHSQSAVTVFAGTAMLKVRKWLRIVLIAVAVLVPLSRMYLGVHTPADVLTGSGLALAILALFYPIFLGKGSSSARIRAVMAGSALLTVAYLIFVNVTVFPADVDAESLHNAVKNAWTLTGTMAGLWLSFEIDQRYLHFDVKATMTGQVLKLVLGLGIAVALRAGLKPLLNVVFAGHPAADMIRYFVIAAFAGCVWPMSFKRLAKIGK